MKLIFTRVVTLLLAGAFTIFRVSAQDASINILAGGSGVVSIGGSIFLQVDVTNNDATNNIVQNKVRPQISVPAGISSISLTAADHTLPPGWTITSNSGAVIRITNTTDPIPAGVTRTSLIRILGGPNTGSGNILANLTFVGAAPSGDNPANNSSSSGITTSTIPVTLTNFNAVLFNCEPTLKWTTETEINSDRFEIERSSANNSNWVKIGTVTANGNSSTKLTYSLTDKSTVSSTEKMLYRLKVIDKDGRYSYSGVLPVSTNCSNSKLAVFPNPVQEGRLYISLTGAKENAEGTLLSLSGQVMLRTRLNNGTNKLDVAGLANGIYILNVVDGNKAVVAERLKVIISQ